MWNFVSKTLFSQRISDKGVCFFDIDGVLNTSSDWSKPYTFRRDLVTNLCTLAKEKNLDLIMTSSWRKGFSASMSENNLPHMKRLEEAMAEFGIKIKGKTPVFKGDVRDIEIRKYLSYHPYSRRIVIDDDRSEYFSIDDFTFVLTDPTKGFDAAALKKAMKLIGGNKRR